MQLTKDHHSIICIIIIIFIQSSAAATIMQPQLLTGFSYPSASGGSLGHDDATECQRSSPSMYHQHEGPYCNVTVE